MVNLYQEYCDSIKRAYSHTIHSTLQAHTPNPFIHTMNCILAVVLISTCSYHNSLWMIPSFCLYLWPIFLTIPLTSNKLSLKWLIRFHLIFFLSIFQKMKFFRLELFDRSKRSMTQRLIYLTLLFIPQAVTSAQNLHDIFDNTFLHSLNHAFIILVIFYAFTKPLFTPIIVWLLLLLFIPRMTSVTFFV